VSRTTVRTIVSTLDDEIDAAFETVSELRMVVSRLFRTFGLAERHPALAYAVMAPLIC
jgi:hypothetical protein